MTDFFLDCLDGQEDLEKVLVGRRVVNAHIETGNKRGYLLLDNGLKIEVVGNEGCCCGYGDYLIANMATTPNVITAVNVEVDELSASHTGNVVLFVLCEDKRYNIVSAEGEDNGWYGYGFSFRVISNKKHK